MPFDFLRRSHRVPTELAREAATAVAAWRWLDADQRVTLVDDTQALMDELRWEAARGFDLTDDVRATIAAHAALLTVELGLDCYHEVSSVIVHSTSFESHGEHHIGGGLYSDDTVELLGQANHLGPVIIAWDAASAQARHPEHGHNVIFHEFAHHLDMLDGWVDGTPPLPDEAARRRWIEVCTDAYERLRRGDTGGVLDGYGAVDPGEFFAVATEVFFARPVDLDAARPDLYRVFADFYLLDPVAAGAAR